MRRFASSSPANRCTAALLWLASVAFGLLSVSAQAQTLYRSTGPDGRVSFSDMPPPTNQKEVALYALNGSTTDAASSALPYHLRQISSKYPVTLFSAKDCLPCDEGRDFLRHRGIPFVEKTVDSNEDIEALNRLTAGKAGLPLLYVGKQRINGYSAIEWAQYLNAAGYPEKNTLPSSYRPPQPSPLAGTTAVAPSQTKSTDANPVNPSTPSTPRLATPANKPTSNPAGIEF